MSTKSKHFILYKLVVRNIIWFHCLYKKDIYNINLCNIPKTFVCIMFLSTYFLNNSYNSI